MNIHEDPIARLRFLEGWLPLAQAENERQGWGYDGPGLERLILQAAPYLRRAESLNTARLVLWFAHSEHQRSV